MSVYETFRAVAGPHARICRDCFRELVPYRIIALKPVIVEWERFSKPGKYNTTVRLGYKDWRCSCGGATRGRTRSCYHIRRLYHDEGMNRIPVYQWPAMVAARLRAMTGDKRKNEEVLPG